MSSSFNRGNALIIGVGADLPNTVDDAVGLANILRDPARCAYPSHQVHQQTAESATRHHILAGLDKLAQVPPDSTVIVYFSGHGYEFSSTFGKSYFLMPFGYDVNQLAETAISSQELTAKLQAIPAQKLLLLLDCCHAGGLDPSKAPAGAQMSKAPLPPEATTLLAQGNGRAVIASSRADELSYAGKPYSAFTLALIEALAGQGAAQQDGYVRLTDLAGHTRQMVPQRTNDRQHPILNFQQADNFVVAYYAGGDTTPKAMPFSAQPQIEPEPGAFNRQAAPSFHAKLEGDGAIAQGEGATALGAGSIKVDGNVDGNIITGDNNVINLGQKATSSVSLPPNLAPMRDNIALYFNTSEIDTVCFDLGIPFDELPGDTRTEKAQSLVEHCFTRGRLPELRKICQRKRPHVSW